MSHRAFSDDDRAFIRAILTNPAEVSGWLVYAGRGPGLSLSQSAALAQASQPVSPPLAARRLRAVRVKSRSGDSPAN
jgi:hypothetical protein